MYEVCTPCTLFLVVVECLWKMRMSLFLWQAGHHRTDGLQRKLCRLKKGKLSRKVLLRLLIAHKSLHTCSCKLNASYETWNRKYRNIGISYFLAWFFVVLMCNSYKYYHPVVNFGQLPTLVLQTKLDCFQLELYELYPNYGSVLSTRTVKILYQFQLKLDKPQLWAPQFLPLQKGYINWCRLLQLLPIDWAISVHRKLVNGIDLKCMLTPPKRSDDTANLFKSEPKFYQCLLALIKDLTLKHRNRSILAGPFSHKMSVDIFCNIMVLYKKASNK